MSASEAYNPLYKPGDAFVFDVSVDSPRSAFKVASNSSTSLDCLDGVDDDGFDTFLLRSSCFLVEYVSKGSVMRTLQHPAKDAATSVAPTPIFFPNFSSYVLLSLVNARKYRKLDDSECTDFALAPEYNAAMPSVFITFESRESQPKPLPLSPFSRASAAVSA